MKHLPIIGVILPFLLIAMMISSQTLWIDEGDTAIYAQQPTFSDFCHHLQADSDADCQMPLSMFIAWAVDKVMGHSEWVLRSPNLVWAWISLILLVRIGKKKGMPWLPLLFVAQPYLWFYMDEARPYVLQIMCGCFLLWSLIIYNSKEEWKISWVIPFVFGAVLLSYATLLAPIALVALILAGLWVNRKQEGGQGLKHRELLWLGAGGLFCVPVGFYYLQTILHGSGGAKLWEPGLANIAYIFYELTGFSGLGPPPIVIRELAQSGNVSRLFVNYSAQWILIGSLALALLVLGWKGLTELRNHKSKRDLREFTSCILALIVAATFFLALSILLHKVFWARHLAPLFPFICYAIALLGKAVIHSEPVSTQRWRMVPVFFVLIAWGYSSLNTRFGSSFRKEDYRSVSRKAQVVLNNGGSVAWAASWHCACYYGLPFDSDGKSTDKAFLMLFGAHRVGLETLQEPSLIVIGKSYIYDGSGDLRQWAITHGYRTKEKLSAFELYTR